MDKKTRFLAVFSIIIFSITLVSGILFGMPARAQTGSLSLSPNTWTKLTPITTNTSGLGGSYNNRAYTMAGYDSIGKRMILWEGDVNDNLSCPRRYSIYSNGIWGFDSASKNLTLLKVNNWTNPASDWTTSACPENSNDPTPVNRHPAFAYVSDKNAIYAFGGLNIRIAGANGAHPIDTWKLNLSTNSWTQLPLSPPSSPDKSTEPWASMVYDPSARKIVLVDLGPTAGGEYTWLFNVDTETYEMLSATPRPYLGVSAGNNLAYDSTRQRVWLFGAASGGTYDTGGNELWQLNTATKVWTKINPTGALPPNRIYHGFSYISKYDVFMVYGGATKGDGGVNLIDTWIYSPTTNSWTQLSVISPTSSKFIDMVYDEANDAVIVHIGVDINPEWWAFRYVPSSGDGINPTLTNIAENTWTKLSPKAFNSGGSDITSTGFPYNAYSGTVYSSDYKSIVMFGGGGHGGRRGNSVWLYDTAKNEWREQQAPDPLTNYPYSVDDTGMIFDTYCQTTDNLSCNPLSNWLPPGTTNTDKPWTSHNYDQMAWDSYNKKYVFFGPNFAFGYNLPYYYGLPDAFTYDIPTKTWTHMSNKPNLYHQMSKAEYDPANRLVVAVGLSWTKPGYKYLATNQVWVLDVTTGIWTKKGNPPSSFNDANMVYDTANGRMLIYGQDYSATGDLWSYNAVTDVWTKLNPTSDPVYGLPPAGAPNAAFDSKNKIMLIWGEGDTGSFIPTWAYNVQTNSWKKMNPSSEAGSGAGVGANLIYDPANDVFFLVKNSGAFGTISGFYGEIGELWVYRYKATAAPPSDTTPPSIPMGLAATAVSSSQINLSWTVSTDTGGSGLAGYRIYRCQGAGCTPSTQIATAVTNSYSDTGLTANTIYVYRVAAYDAVGNVSGQSTSASATTQSGSVSCTNSVTSPSTVITESSMSKPALLTPATDNNFPCTTITRVTNSPSGSISVPLYSQLQAWNADQSLLLVTDGGYKILNASTYQTVHTIDWGWPDWGETPRWSPIEPYVLYYIDDNNSFCSAAALMRYRLNSSNLALRTRELVKCFPEYSQFNKNQSWEELSVDGRYIALMGVKVSNSRNEIFLYDVINNIKGATLELPAGRDCDHVQPSPLGNYVVLTCGAGTAGFNGVEIYDKNMNYLRNLHLYTDHSDLAVDQNNVEWLVVFDNQIGNGAVAKKRISDGYRVDLIVPSTPAWQGSHISCQSPQTGWCTYSTVRNAANGWEAREGEIIKIYLDSTVSVPHLERLAHHRSDPIYTGDGSPDNCPTVDRYWTDPHQTSSPNGSKIIFGSSWGQNCFVESYVINLSAAGDTTPPASPTGVQVQ